MAESYIYKDQNDKWRVVFEGTLMMPLFENHIEAGQALKARRNNLLSEDATKPDVSVSKPGLLQE